MVIVDGNNLNVELALIDFSVNICNIKQYLKIGSYEEIMKYTNISFPILEQMLFKNKNPLFFFQNLQIIQHVINNCGDLDKSSRSFEYLCASDIDANILVLLINAGLPVQINKVLEDKMIKIIKSDQKKSMNNAFIVYILKNYNNLSQFKRLVFCAYMYSNIELVNELLNNKCEIVLHEEFKERFKVVLKKSDFMDNIMHFIQNDKNTICQLLQNNKNQWLRFLASYSPLNVIIKLNDLGYDLTNKKLLLDVIFNKRDDEILLYLLPKCSLNDDYIISCIIRFSSLVVIEYLFNNFGTKVKVLATILLSDRFASSWEAQQNLKNKIFNQKTTFHICYNFRNDLRLDKENNKIIIERMIKKCNDDDFCYLLELTFLNIEEDIVFNLLFENLKERTNITKHDMKNIANKIIHNNYNSISKYQQDMLNTCINSKDPSFEGSKKWYNCLISNCCI